MTLDSPLRLGACGHSNVLGEWIKKVACACCRPSGPQRDGRRPEDKQGLLPDEAQRRGCAARERAPAQP